MSDYQKEKWGSGPWRSEPDRVEFEHAGLPCLIVRNQLGGLCGYAAVSPGHPLHGEHYRVPDVDVHGGLTYASACQEGGKICHVPKPGQPADVWWFGFDCGHYGDLTPGMADIRLGGVYRNLAYVRRETERLAEQLATAGSAVS